MKSLNFGSMEVGFFMSECKHLQKKLRNLNDFINTSLISVFYTTLYIKVGGYNKNGD